MTESFLLASYIATIASAVVLPAVDTSLVDVVMAMLPLCNNVTVTLDGMSVFSEGIS